MHACFLDDIDPIFILIITVNKTEYVSYLYIAKIKPGKKTKLKDLDVQEHDEER